MKISWICTEARDFGDSVGMKLDHIGPMNFSVRTNSAKPMGLGPELVDIGGAFCPYR